MFAWLLQHSARDSDCANWLQHQDIFVCSVQTNRAVFVILELILLSPYENSKDFILITIKGINMNNRLDGKEQNREE